MKSEQIKKKEKKMRDMGFIVIDARTKVLLRLALCCICMRKSLVYKLNILWLYTSL